MRRRTSLGGMTDDVEVRVARDDELERVVRLRWLWAAERGTDIRR